MDNVSVRVEAVVGKATLTVAEVGNLTNGDTLTLETALNELMELRVNGVVIAHGELVTVDDKFGVRIHAVAT